MGTWFWLNIPFMLLFLGCWAGIPMWHTLRRWDAELKAKHAGLAPLATPAIGAIPDQSSRRVEPSIPVTRELAEDERPSRY